MEKYNSHISLKKFILGADQDCYKKLNQKTKLLKFQNTDYYVPKPSSYIYNIAPVSKARVTLWKRGKKDLKARVPRCPL